MRVGSLCTGYGGIELGLLVAGMDVELAWVAENEPALSPVLPDVDNLGDIATIKWNRVDGVDLLTAGFPCQPTSAAGRQLGTADPRWIWPSVYKGIRRLKPRLVLIENVRNLVSYDSGRLWTEILDDLRRAKYGVRWLTMGACAVGAAHHRHRVFALAVAGERGVEQIKGPGCGARGEIVLPTPAAVNYGSNRGGMAGRVGPIRHSLDSLAKLELLPTPTVGNITGGNRTRSGKRNAELLLPGVAQAYTSGDLLPTPQGRDGQGRGTPNSETAKRRYASGRRNIDDALALLPTVTTRDGNAGPGLHGQGAPNLRTMVTLLPTPTARDGDGRGEGRAGFWDNRQTYRSNGIPLGAALNLLPTPRGSEARNGSPNQHGRKGDLMLSSGVQPGRWGQFADAVARHAAIYGAPPAPTEPNRNGEPRLSPAFAEWLMVLPSGHVAARLERLPALKAIGNGVCPPQLAVAWLILTEGGLT